MAMVDGGWCKGLKNGWVKKMAKMRGELADCCMLYGGKIIIEGGSSLCTHPLQQKSSYYRGRAGVW
jgi:hypothetical protein